MKQITDINELLKKLNIPGVLGLENNGDIEIVNKEIVSHAPLKLTLQALPEGKIYSCQNL